MKKLVGFLTTDQEEELKDTLSRVKHHSLLFDQISFSSADYKMNRGREIFLETERYFYKIHKKHGEIRSFKEYVKEDLRWYDELKLIDKNGIIFNSEKFAREGKFVGFQEEFINEKRLEDWEVLRSLDVDSDYDCQDPYENEARFEMVKEYFVRFNCLYYNTSPLSREAICIPITSNYGSNVTELKSNTYKLVLEKIPIPSLETPWEKIIEFRNDEDSKGTLSGLRRWITETVKAKNSIEEIEEELEYLLYQYSKALKIHKMKTQAGILESLVVGVTEFAENTLKLKFGQLAKGMFSIRKIKAERMEAELNSPGAELAYLYRAKERFE